MSTTIQWYRHLKPNSENKYPSLLEKFNPIANPSLRFVNRATWNDVREYAAFQTHIDLFRYVAEKSNMQCFLHEVPLAVIPQKPRFDIDIDADLVPDFMEFGKNLRERLIERIIVVLAENGFECDLKHDLCLYQSHRSEKYSSHIVLPYLYHNNRADALAFYEMVVGDDAELKTYVDRRIYDANHSLRLIWCRKDEDSQPKLPEINFSFRGVTHHHEPKMPYRNDKIKLLRIFEESLISFVTYSQPLPNWAPDRPEYQVDDIPREIADEMILMLKDTLQENAPFVYFKTDGGIVNLRRLRPSHCPLCSRVHKKIGTFLTLNNHNGKVHWRCGRCDERLEVGCLSEEKLHEMNSPSYLVEMVEQAQKQEGFNREEYDKMIDLIDCIFPEETCYEPLLIESSTEAPPPSKPKKERVVFEGVACVMPVAPQKSATKIIPRGKITVRIDERTLFKQIREEMIQESLKPKKK